MLFDFMLVCLFGFEFSLVVAVVTSCCLWLLISVQVVYVALFVDCWLVY